MLTYDLLQFALLFLIAASAAPLGTLLVARKEVMIANAISHTALLGIILPVIFLSLLGYDSLLSGVAIYHIILKPELLLAAGLTTALVTSGTIYLFQRLLTERQTAIGVTFLLLLALGITLISLYFRNLHLGFELLVGSIEMADSSLLIPLSVLAFLAWTGFLLFYSKWQLLSFDSIYGKIIGLPINLFSFLLVVFTSFYIVMATPAIGTMTALAFLVLPSLSIYGHILPGTSPLLQLAKQSLIIVAIASAAGILSTRILYILWGFSLPSHGVTILFLLGHCLIQILSPKKTHVI